MRSELPLGRYEHYKGKPYEVLGSCFHTETMEKLVVYRSLYESDFPYGAIWVRPFDMFIEEIEVDGKKQPRFKFVGS